MSPGLFTVVSGVGTAECKGKKTTQFETDGVHFSQKSAMSLNYLALETGQSRAAVSCLNRLLTVTALQISPFPIFIFCLLSGTAFSLNYCVPGSQKASSTGASGDCESIGGVKVSWL